MKVYLPLVMLLLFAGCKKTPNHPLDNGIFYSGRYSTFNYLFYDKEIVVVNPLSYLIQSYKLR